MHPLQEKFQIMVPNKGEGDEGPWVSDSSARHTRPVDTSCMNDLPPGMGIDQENSDIRNMPLSLAGRTDVSDHMNQKAIDDGFAKLPMKGCDDQYTGEHVDHFYGDAGGFVERNNYLDRE